MGACGEPCPYLCRRCEPEADAFEIFFGEEEDKRSMFVQLEECGHAFEAKGLDTWMKPGDDDVTGDKDIQLKKCPKCSTCVRRTVRFKNATNRTLEQIQNVKRVQWKEFLMSRSEESRLQKVLKHSMTGKQIMKGRELKRMLQEEGKAVETLVKISDRMLKVSKGVLRTLHNKEYLVQLEADGWSAKVLHCELERFDMWIQCGHKRLSDQQTKEATRELTRISLMTHLLKLEVTRRSRDVMLSDENTREIDEIRRELWKGTVSIIF